MKDGTWQQERTNRFYIYQIEVVKLHAILVGKSHCILCILWIYAMVVLTFFCIAYDISTLHWQRDRGTHREVLEEFSDAGKS